MLTYRSYKREGATDCSEAVVHQFHNLFNAPSFLLSHIIPTEELEKIKRIDGFKRVRFIFLYGSAAEGRLRPDSDIDLCMYYDGTEEDAARFRFTVLSELGGDRYDVQLFQQLPLYVRVEVLKGELIYCADTRFVYDVAVETIKEFESFKHRFYDYIGEQAIT